MFNYKTNISIYFLFLFLFIPFDLKAIDEFDYNLLSEKLNRLEQEISDIQKSIYSTNDNTSIKENTKSVNMIFCVIVKIPSFCRIHSKKTNNS